MSRYAAFLRAVNVPGHARVDMADVKAAFLAAGCTEVSTYIQSGNILFVAPQPSAAAVLEQIRVQVQELIGGPPGVAVRDVAELEAIVNEAPFGSLTADRTIKLYVAFLFQQPSNPRRFPLSCSQEALQAVAMRRHEVFIVSRRKPNGFYGFPNNFIERELGVTATTRNWSTVTRILELLRSDLQEAHGRRQRS